MRRAEGWPVWGSVAPRAPTAIRGGLGFLPARVRICRRLTLQMSVTGGFPASLSETCSFPPGIGKLVVGQRHPVFCVTCCQLCMDRLHTCLLWLHTCPEVLPPHPELRLAGKGRSLLRRRRKVWIGGWMRPQAPQMAALPEVGGQADAKQI